MQGDSVAWTDLDDFGDIGGGGCGGGCCGGGDGCSELGEHVLDPGGGDVDEHARGFGCAIAEGVGVVAGGEDVVAGFGGELSAVCEEGDFAFEDGEVLVFAGVGVRGRSASGADDGVDDAALAAGVVAGGEEAVEITEDGESGRGERGTEVGEHASRSAGVRMGRVAEGRGRGRLGLRL